MIFGLVTALRAVSFVVWIHQNQMLPTQIAWTDTQKSWLWQERYESPDIQVTHPCLQHLAAIRKYILKHTSSWAEWTFTSQNTYPQNKRSYVNQSPHTHAHTCTHMHSLHRQKTWDHCTSYRWKKCFSLSHHWVVIGTKGYDLMMLRC